LKGLRDVLDRCETKADDALLFSNFVSRHPGIEHFGGVARGGTFVLVYGDDAKVVGDFMLPYCAEEEVKEVEPDEPPLEKPTFHDPWIVDNGIKIIPSRTKFFDDRIRKIREEIELKINDKIKIQKDWLEVFKTTADVFGGLKGKPGGGPFDPENPLDPKAKYTDPLLKIRMGENDFKRQRIELVKRLVEQPEITAEAKAQYQRQLDAAEVEYVAAVVETAGHLEQANADFAPGGEGLIAVLEMAKSFKTLSPAAKSSLQTGLKAVGEKTTRSDAQAALRIVAGSAGALPDK
jgi:hypothetical protein